MLELNNVSSKIIRIASFQKILFSFILLSLFSLSANGQNFDLKQYSFEVNGEILENPMTGGFTAPQLSEIDLNMDGQLDLLVFDRRGGVAKAFFHDGVPGSLNYTHDPFYERSLPTMNGFLRVADYNGDGVPDIFTGPAGSGNIAVYKGTWDGTQIRYSLYLNGDYPFDVLTVVANGSPVNVFSSPVDVPAILDVDGDGDVDVLSFESGGSFVSYYKNMSLEKGLGLDTFDFILDEFCWANFKEGGFDGTIFLSDNINDCAEEFAPQDDFTERHAGSTIEAFDYQCDGDLDLLIGDLVSSNVVLIVNEPQGGKDFAVEWVQNFPENDPIDIYVFPSTWVLDIDHDGDEDIIGCPNEDSNAINVANFHLYENVGGECNSNYELKQLDFLTETGIDLGTDATPAFLDYNQDGLLDLLVGTTGEYDAFGQPESLALMLYENIGTADLPSFRLVNDDYLGFSVNSPQFSTNPTVAVGDISGDGNDDIIVGDASGNLYYFENTAVAGAEYTFAQAVYPFMNLNVGGNTEPYIYDYNQDGLGDLFLGEKNSNTNVDGLGSINYVQNKGSVGSPFFDEENNELPNTYTFNYVFTKDVFSSNTNAAPCIFKVGERLLGLFGTEQGCLQLWELVEGDVDAQAVMLENCFGGIDEGDQTSVDVADIDNDGFLEMVIGNKRGGIVIHNTIIQVDGTISDIEDNINMQIQIDIYPNPVKDILNIGSDLDLGNYKLLNTFGQVIKTGVLAGKQVSISNIQAGVYFISLEINGQEITKKFIKQ